MKVVLCATKLVVPLAVPLADSRGLATELRRPITLADALFLSCAASSGIVSLGEVTVETTVDDVAVTVADDVAVVSRLTVTVRSVSFSAPGDPRGDVLPIRARAFPSALPMLATLAVSSAPVDLGLVAIVDRPSFLDLITLLIISATAVAARVALVFSEMHVHWSLVAKLGCLRAA